MSTPPVYYLICDFGKIGRETVIDWENCSKADVLRRIQSGDYGGKLLAVHCIDREFGLWCDVSQEIAAEIADLATEEPAGELFEFLEHTLGCRYMADLARERFYA